MITFLIHVNFQMFILLNLPATISNIVLDLIDSLDSVDSLNIY